MPTAAASQSGRIRSAENIDSCPAVESGSRRRERKGVGGAPPITRRSRHPIPAALGRTWARTVAPWECCIDAAGICRVFEPRREAASGLGTPKVAWIGRRARAIPHSYVVSLDAARWGLVAAWLGRTTVFTASSCAPRAWAPLGWPVIKATARARVSGRGVGDVHRGTRLSISGALSPDRRRARASGCLRQVRLACSGLLGRPYHPTRVRFDGASEVDVDDRRAGPKSPAAAHDASGANH